MALELEAVIGFSGAYRSKQIAPTPARTAWASLVRLRKQQPLLLRPTRAGKVLGGLQWHANGTHLVYALGSTVIIKSLVDGSQSFLTGHTGNITALALSKCGRYIASGQLSEMGRKVRLVFLRSAPSSGCGYVATRTREMLTRNPFTFRVLGRPPPPRPPSSRVRLP